MDLLSQKCQEPSVIPPNVDDEGPKEALCAFRWTKDEIAT
jgi:hypothetical protein